MGRKIQYMVCADCRFPLTEEEVRFYTTQTSDTIFKTSYCEDCFEKRIEAQRKLERGR